MSEWYPVVGGGRIPWSVLAPHEAQAQRNHDQTLTRLAERGGLGLQEMVAIVRDQHWRTVLTMTDEAAREILRPMGLEDGSERDWNVQRSVIGKIRFTVRLGSGAPFDVHVTDDEARSLSRQLSALAAPRALEHALRVAAKSGWFTRQAVWLGRAGKDSEKRAVQLAAEARKLAGLETS